MPVRSPPVRFECIAGAIRLFAFLSAAVDSVRRDVSVTCWREMDERTLLAAATRLHGRWRLRRRTHAAARPARTNGRSLTAAGRSATPTHALGADMANNNLFD